MKQGFAFIEVMLVSSIIIILLAIAIPSCMKDNEEPKQGTVIGIISLIQKNNEEEYYLKINDTQLFLTRKHCFTDFSNVLDVLQISMNKQSKVKVKYLALMQNFITKAESFE